MEPELLLRHLQLNRRTFLHRAAVGIGSLALGSLLGCEQRGGAKAAGFEHLSGLGGLPHFAPKAKRVIYLFQSGAPSQLELFDWKPLLRKMNGQELPEGKVPKVTFEIGADGSATARFPAGDKQYKLTLDPGKNPKAMDIVLTDGGDKQYAIYKLEDGKLTIAATPPGGNEEDRPQDFNQGRALVCERVKGE